MVSENQKSSKRKRRLNIGESNTPKPESKDNIHTPQRGILDEEVIKSGFGTVIDVAHGNSIS